MGKIYYCPECKSALEELSGCGVTGYFCNKCNKLISRSRMLADPADGPRADEKEKTSEKSGDQ